MAVLLILAALAFDVGMMLVERRDQQNAADAAALAGARFVLDDPSRAEAAAVAIASRNGFDDADPEEVSVYIPPIHGTYRGFPGFIEVQIAADRPSIFGGILGRAVWPVGAYAVATNQQNLTFPFSMLALDPTACKAIQVTGGGEVNAAGSVQSNSTGEGCGDGSNISFSRTGLSTINIGEDIYCRAVGVIQDEGRGEMDCTPAPNSFGLPDPLIGLPPPASAKVLAPPMDWVGPGTAPTGPPKYCPGRTGADAPRETGGPQPCDLGSSGYAGTAWILHPGWYPHGLAVTADSTAYLLPGIYWIGGNGITVKTGGWLMSIDEPDQAQVDPTLVAWEPARAAMTPPSGLGGVMIYNSDEPASGGGITQDSNESVIKLMPLRGLPGTDPSHIYNNIAIFQDRSLNAPGDDLTLNGSSSNTVVGGLVYIPAGDVKLNGNEGTLTLGQVIAATYTIAGDGFFYITESDLFESIIVAAGLVE